MVSEKSVPANVASRPGEQQTRELYIKKGDWWKRFHVASVSSLRLIHPGRFPHEGLKKAAGRTADPSLRSG
jgi:hypothetical protein